MLSSFKLQDFELCQIYNCRSHAYEPLQMADRSHSRVFMKSYMDYIDDQPDSLFKATAEDDGMLKWMPLAHQYGLHNLYQMAIVFIVNSRDLERDRYIHELPSALLVQPVQAYQTLEAA